jgi:hypothetical protein
VNHIHAPRISRFAGLAALGLTIYAAPAVASAANFTMCLRIPVTIADTGGFAGVIGGGTGNWIARGMKIESVKVGATTVASNIFADDDTGCFTVSHTAGSHVFSLVVRSEGMVGDDNDPDMHVMAKNSSGTIGSYAVTSPSIASGGSSTFALPSEWILPRIYAIVAYAVDDGFRGWVADTSVTAWWTADGDAGGSPCSTDDSPFSGAFSCTSGGAGHITFRDSDSARRFVLAHEWGHLTLSLAPFTYGSNNCGGDGHGMRGVETTDCAAMEGWAHFVSVDTWNSGQHSGGDPVGFMKYWGGGNALINVEADQGGCATMSGDTALNYQLAYADTCFQSGWAADPACSSGDCDNRGVELDWMRAWWDYHTDGDITGTLPDHADLQSDIGGTAWNNTNAWTIIRSNMSQIARFDVVASGNGISEP